MQNINNCEALITLMNNGLYNKSCSSQSQTAALKETNDYILINELLTELISRMHSQRIRNAKNLKKNQIKENNPND